jgi:integrase
MGKKKLTATNIEKLARPAPGKRIDYWDTVQPGFGVRVTAANASFVFGGRFPGSANFTRREIGPATAAGLVDARETARRWMQMIGAGVDPARERERIRQEEARKTAHTLAAVAEQFVSTWVIGDPAHPRQRQWKEMRRLVGGLVAALGSTRPIFDIGRDEIVRVVKAKAQTAPAEARNVLGAAKQLFSWAREQDFGLAHNITADIKPGRIIGEKHARERALSVDELRQLWIAAGNLGWPVAPIYRLLILTGLRLGEVVGAAWSEIDLVKGAWVIQASRMKGKEGRARAHIVPLTQRMADIFASLPRTGGEHVFSYGAKPVVVSTRIKSRLDRVLSFATPWQNHDIRRGVRSGLAGLGVKDEVAEAVLAHTPVGIRNVYNKHLYLDERREALECWGELVASGGPAGGDVVPLRRRHAALAG